MEEVELLRDDWRMVGGGACEKFDREAEAELLNPSVRSVTPGADGVGEEGGESP